MKNIFALVFVIASINLAAQVKFNTGDIEFDSDLTSINATAKLDLTAFHADLTATFGVSSKNLEYMTSINMEPGEIYLALEIAASVNKPVESVVDMYEANKAKGWGYIAQQMGIAPGSAEFHALKAKSKSKKENSGNSNGNVGNSNGKAENAVNTHGNSVSKKKK